MFNIPTLFEGRPAPVSRDGTGGGMVLINGADLNVNAQWDPGLMQPYRGDDGRIYVDVTLGHKFKRDKDGGLVYNAGAPVIQKVTQPQLVLDRMRQGLPVAQVDNATVLRKDQWITLDTAAKEALRKRLRAWADLRAASTFSGFDGMATPILEYETVTDAGEAIADMEAIAEGRNFQPNFGLQGLPLPITHADFWLSERFLAASRAKGMPADTLRAAMAGRRVGELLEKTLIGTETGVTYGASGDYHGTSKVYGYTNHPNRITKTDLHASSSLTGAEFIEDILEMREQMYGQNLFGPFMVYVSTAYDAKLDVDFKAEVQGTIRQRALAIEGILGIRRLDYLTGDVIIMVEMTPENVRAVNGLDVVTVQWQQKGGMQKMFKVMTIQAPQFFIRNVSGTTTYVTGVLHGTTS